jgi:ribonucleoside-diphosphate reductase alpha chain
MNSQTRFTDPDAVEAWDALFRWREGDRLRDTTVEETWQRVAEAVATPEGEAAAQWASRFADAFRKWQLLPDERLLRDAGTQRKSAPLREPAVVLNAAAFVVAPPFSPVRVLRSQLVESAQLAVRFLDDALLAEAPENSDAALRIGLIGVTDALLALRAPAGGLAASRYGDIFAQALSEGCLRGSVELAIERGPRVQVDADFRQRWRRRGVPDELLERAELHGLRFAELTAICPHPTLARLANGVHDGIDWKSDGTENGSREHLRLAMQRYFDLPIPP